MNMWSSEAYSRFLSSTGINVQPGGGWSASLSSSTGQDGQLIVERVLSEYTESTSLIVCNLQWGCPRIDSADSVDLPSMNGTNVQFAAYSVWVKARKYVDIALHCRMHVQGAHPLPTSTRQWRPARALRPPSSPLSARRKNLQLAG